MRSYIFDFDQKRCIEKGLDIQDCLILYYLQQFGASGNAFVSKFEGKLYMQITYNKILKDLPILNLKNRMLRYKFDKYIKLGLITKYKPILTTTKLFINLNLECLYDYYCADLKQEIGQDATLKNYFTLDESVKGYALIKYNRFNYIYECPLIDAKIIKYYGENYFFERVKFHMQKILTETVFGMFRTAIFSLKNGSIRIEHNVPEAVVEMNMYKIERAIVDSYITILH